MVQSTRKNRAKAPPPLTNEPLEEEEILYQRPPEEPLEEPAAPLSFDLETINRVWGPLVGERLFASIGVTPDPDRPGRFRKKPLQLRSEWGADSTNPDHLFPLEEIVPDLGPWRYPGFNLNGEGIWCLDKDDCVKDGKLSPEAQALVADCGSYAEISLSGTGVHIFGFVQGDRLPKVVQEDGVEAYATKHFIALTGVQIAGTPDKLIDCTEAVRSRYGPKAKDPEPPGSEAQDGPKTGRARLDELLENGAPEGQRDNAKIEFLGICRGLGYSRQVTRALLREFAKVCRPPFDADDQKTQDQLDRAFRDWQGGEPRDAKILRPLNFQTIAEVEQLPPQRQVIEGWLIAETVALLSGSPGIFKSFAVLDMALSIVTGQDWWGYQVAKGQVLWIAAEGARGTPNRVRAWEKHHEVKVGEGFKLLGHELDFYNPEIPDFVYLQVLAAGLDNLRLIVLDTLSRNSGNARENDNNEMGRVMRNAERLAQLTGSCVLLIHHDTKSTGTSRGASSVAGGVQTCISAVGTAQSIILSVSKQKDHQRPDSLPLTGTVVDLGNGASSIVLTQGMFDSMSSGGTGGKNEEAVVYAALVDQCKALGSDLNNSAWQTYSGLPRKRYEAARDTLIRDGRVLERKAGREKFFRPNVGQEGARNE